MITRLITSECSSKKPVIRARYQPTPTISLLLVLASGGSPWRVGNGRNDDYGRENVCANLLTSANSVSRVVKSLDSHPFRLHRLATVFAAETTSEMRACGSTSFSNNRFSPSNSSLIKVTTQSP